MCMTLNNLLPINLDISCVLEQKRCKLEGIEIANSSQSWVCRILEISLISVACYGSLMLAKQLKQEKNTFIPRERKREINIEKNENISERKKNVSYNNIYVLKNNF